MKASEEMCAKARTALDAMSDKVDRAAPQASQWRKDELFGAVGLAFVLGLVTLDEYQTYCDKAGSK